MPHLLFAENTLFFFEATKKMAYVSWTLMWFEHISRLKINLRKSEIIIVCKLPNAEGLARVLMGCNRGNLPTTYLGLPLGGEYKSRTMWDVVEEKMRKLSIWKMNYISPGSGVGWKRT